MIVDTTMVKKLMAELNTTRKENTKAFRAAFRQSAGIIQKEAKKNLKGVTNKRGITLRSKNLLQFVRTTIYKSGKGANVTILPDQRRKTDRRLAKKGLQNHSFLLRFFEQGTRERYTGTKIRNGEYKGEVKASNYRGRIEVSNFFSRAVKSKKKEAEKNVEKAVVAQINKIVKKRR